MNVSNNVVQCILHPGEIGRRLFEKHKRCIGIHAHGREGLFEFVSDGGRRCLSIHKFVVSFALKHCIRASKERFTPAPLSEQRCKDVCADCQKQNCSLGFKNTIADALQSGAEKLRLQAANETSATTVEAGGSFSGPENRLGQTSNQLAGGMQGAADWLRDADLDGLKAGIERQVKEHPGRSLAIAVGVGYLLGKAFRRQ